MAPKVIMFCDNCTLYGVPAPENVDTCGNCGSRNVTVYYPAAQAVRFFTVIVLIALFLSIFVFPWLFTGGQ